MEKQPAFLTLLGAVMHRVCGLSASEGVRRSGKIGHHHGDCQRGTWGCTPSSNFQGDVYREIPIFKVFFFKQNF